MSLVATTLTVLEAAPAGAADVVWGPWQGEISVSIEESILIGDDVLFDRQGSGTYTNVRSVGEFFPGQSNRYLADVDVSFHEDNYSSCGDARVSAVSDWNYAGPSTEVVEAANGHIGFGQDGVPVELRDADDGSGTYIFTRYVGFNAVKRFPACGPFGPSEGLQANDTMGFYAGTGNWTADVLNDADIDPSHLVGTTSWSLGNYPTGSAPYNYAAYSYVLTYDLTREALVGGECDDGEDNDGDGLVDYPADPGCLSANDPTERDSQCEDGLDNDGDGESDASDPGCSSWEDDDEHGLVECDNGLDDDGNGLIDYRAGGAGDPGCESLVDAQELLDGCANAPAHKRHRTTLSAPAQLDVLLAPDPHLATINLGFNWCETPSGPRIMTKPITSSDPMGWWDGSQNWVLLGALESFAGLTVDTPTDPVVVHGNVLATVSGSLEANLNAIDLVLSVVPVGKLLKPFKKVLKKYADELNPLSKALKQFNKKVAKATKKTQATGKRVRKARDEVARVRGLLADAKAELEAATTKAERKEITERIEKLKDWENGAKRVERLYSLEHQKAIRDLREVRADRQKILERIDDILKTVRKKLDDVQSLKKKLYNAMDAAVDEVRPDWAREVVRIIVKELKAKLDHTLADMEKAIKELTVRKLEKFLESGDVSGAILNYIKDHYEGGVRAISDIGLPIWDASFTVGLGPNNKPNVADNSESRFLFTVKAEPTLTTS